MTGDASPATDLPSAATPTATRLRRLTHPEAPATAGTFAYTGADVVTDWHHHDLHKIEYALEGLVELETAAAHYLLPPQQAVWVPAGLAHRTTLRRVRSVTVFFAPSMVRGATDRARVLPAAPLIREMLRYATRWPIDRPATEDPLADAFFTALAGLTLDWLDRETPLSLPIATDPLVAAVMEHTNAHLAEVTLGSVCRAVGISERTLRRRFAADTGLTWREYLLHSRLLRAMTLLAETGPTVLDVAVAVGFGSVSAFTRAFRHYAGEAPSSYRRRARTRE